MSQTCTHVTSDGVSCVGEPFLAVRTTASRNQGLKTVVYWDHTDAPKVAQVLCARHGRTLIEDLARDLTGGARHAGTGLDDEHPADCLFCAAGEGQKHNYEPPGGI